MSKESYKIILDNLLNTTPEERLDLLVQLKAITPKKTYRSGQLVEVKIKDKKYHAIVVGGGKKIKLWIPAMCNDIYTSYAIEWECITNHYDEVFYTNNKMPNEDTMKKLKERFKDEK